jgi:hypothetical protein
MTEPNVQLVDRDGVIVLNDTGIDDQTVRDALIGQHPEVAAIVRWTVTTQGDFGRGREGGLFARDRYVTPEQIFAQFRVAQDAAANDDVVSTVLETTESLAFGRLSFAAEDEDQEDIWNQIAHDIDLDTRIREMWRELFTISQFYAVTWWGTKSYKVRGKSPDTGVKRKRTFDNLTVPLGLTLLDPLKVVPVGNLMFNQEQLCYIADRTEVDMLDAAVLNDPQADPVSRQIIIGKYAPPDYERRNLARQGVNADWLYILNPRNVWRHTATRQQYRRFAEVRMTSIFELLDLKHQLRQMDRAYLIGGTNFIVLVKKGTEKMPAKPAEITSLQSQVTTLARVPVIVGDHRLAVEIVTPKTDYTLNPDKYATIDSRITARLYQMFQIHGGSGSVRSDDSVKLAKVIARGLESRRFMIKRTLEREVIGPTVAANPAFDEYPTLRFHPTRIELDFDPASAQMIMELRDRGDLSRDSILNEFDFDQQDEAIKRKREARDYDQTFTMTNVPYSAPGPGHAVPVGPGGKPNEEPQGTATNQPALPPGTPPHSHAPDGTPVPLPSAAPARKAGATPSQQRGAGRTQGGNRNGGGAAPGTGQGQAPRTGTPKPK